jgi:hypothetical protein
MKIRGWRPKGWENPFFKMAVDFQNNPALFNQKSIDEAMTTGGTFEDGADALLEALRELGLQQGRGDFQDMPYRPPIFGGNGIKVFIPDN